MVVKPAAETPLDAFAFADAAEAIGLPPGVINVVTGGRETGAALVDHPGVDKIAFTGSTAAGRVIAARCGERLIPVTLELGGKSPAVVLDDADAAQTLAALKGLSFMNSGQTCFLLSRVLVPRTRLDEFTQGLAEVAQELILGDPRDAATEQGPLVSERIRTRVRGYVEAGTAAGARVVTGGRDLPGAEGFFYEPTIMADVDHAGPLAQEEVFGPVVIVAPYDTDEDAVALANDTAYGLGGAVFSADDERALAHRAPHRDRDDRHQRLPARPRAAVRRLQGLGPRPRARTRGPRQLPEDQGRLPLTSLRSFRDRAATGPRHPVRYAKSRCSRCTPSSSWSSPSAYDRRR
ncbi:aldehyde dehydrogenase family protein [Microbacterium elymi]|uniref:Aldehyde dehydrogenase family protein n=1 Tax=Microbacterium elymi TaxID=2909587 RepID=A0ABY5NI83_9MICO|nr:aldehyde dehydrogenase family protein [Microbacterium elymi]UUT34895.1 aldehyde dehydrogenase family protein [Microbacterium elymi]